MQVQTVINRTVLITGVALAVLACSVESHSSVVVECDSTATAKSVAPVLALPERAGPQVRTSGRVPHVQIGVTPVPALNIELAKRVFMLPGLEERPTISSLPGGKGMWLRDNTPVATPKAILAGREFAHIHTDGSLHVPLPFERALEVQRKGWGERHPWAEKRDGWDGLVMLYSADTTEQLDVMVQLITESYNHITGQTASAPAC